jgi:hypothetical protein
VSGPLLTVDVGHPPRPPHAVEAELLQLWQEARNQPGVRVLKLIHGHGSSGRGGSTREVARNWLFTHRSHFRAIINGEAYALTDAATIALRREVGQYVDADLGQENPGITIVWIR